MRSFLLFLMLVICSTHVLAVTPAGVAQLNSSSPQTQQAAEKKSDDSKSFDTTTILNLFLTFATGVMTYWTSKEQKKATYMQFYEIISRHHSSEITALRREVFSKLDTSVAHARASNQSLLQADPALHLSVSALANYYESIGMFLQGGWNIFPVEARNTMLEMLHNSVTRSWILVDKYKDDIYPDRASDWAGSFQWLNNKTTAFRQEKGVGLAQMFARHSGGTAQKWGTSHVDVIQNISSLNYSPMLIQNESPYIAHVFVCTNDRGGERKSCADNDSQLVKEQLKKAVDGKGWKGKVRVSTSGCMGVCAQGANVMIYPQKLWFSEVSPDDVDAIVSAIERIMEKI